MSETSIADLIQAAMSVIGTITSIFALIFLVRTLKEANKTNKLQLTAQRTASKPILRLETLDMNSINFSKSHIRFYLHIEHKDAFNLQITTTDTHYEMYEEEDLVLKIYHRRVSTDKMVAFGYDLLPIKDLSPPPALIVMQITYNDEMGFKYHQELIAKVHRNEATLSETTFL